jgi:hypothetical protein
LPVNSKKADAGMRHHGHRLGVDRPDEDVRGRIRKRIDEVMLAGGSLQIVDFGAGAYSPDARKA